MNILKDSNVRTCKLSNPLTVVIAILLLGALACGRASPAVVPGDGSIGTIQRVNDSLEHNQARVSGSERVYQNDSVRLFDGGEGLLDLGDLVLRMFNDTQLGGVSVDSAPGAPLSTRIYLELGGFTGKKADTGGQATFETPGGAIIRVYGTTFFLVYDEGSGVTTVGNMDGSLEIESGGSNLPVSPGSSRHASSGQPPSDEQPIPFSIDEFERRAREQASPVAALDLLQPSADVITAEPLPVDNEWPDIGEWLVVPESIVTGPECPASDGTAQVTVTFTNPGRVARAEASWVTGNQSGLAPMERLDEQTFTARVGPAQEAGSMQVTIIAWDSSGTQVLGRSVFIPVFTCIG